MITTYEYVYSPFPRPVFPFSLRQKERESGYAVHLDCLGHDSRLEHATLLYIIHQ